MMLLLAFSWIIFGAEIMLLATVIRVAMRSAKANRAIRLGFTAVAATILAWCIPTEYWIGATMRAGLFEPWGFGSVIIFLVAVALPAAALLDRRKAQ